MARINLCAVLRTLEQLPALDQRAAALCRNVDETIQFTVPLKSASRHQSGSASSSASAVPRNQRLALLTQPVATARRLADGALPVSTMVRLRIADGQISHHTGPGPATIKLAFPSAKAVNAMFAGTGSPIPTKGFGKISFLKGPFTELTDILEHYLRPTPALLDDPDAARANSILTLHLAAYAIAEIGNYDPAGRLNAQRMADGDTVLAVRGTPPIALTLSARHGHLKVSDGASLNRRSIMVFADIDLAGQVLRGELASYTAIGREQLELGGYIPNLDHMNKILGLVPRYLG